MDVFDVEAYLEEQANKSKNQKPNEDNVDRRDKDRDRDRDRRDSRDRKRDRSRDNRRRDSRSRSRDRRSGGRSRRSRSRSNPRRDDRDDRRRDDRREEKKESIEELQARRDRSAERRKERERQAAADRKNKEIDDLTKDQRTIFVSQLTKKTTERDLENFFGQLGSVKNIIMLRDKLSGQHKGFAYVEMTDLEVIPNCLLFNNVVPDFQKFPILVKASEAEKNFLARKDPFSNQYDPRNREGELDMSGLETRLYLGNIHVSIDENALRMVVEQFGPTESVKIHRDHLGNSKGFAFVKYQKGQDAVQAMTALPGMELAGRPLKVGPVIDNKGGASSGGGGGGDNNWQLDADDSGGAGMIMNSSSRAMLMAKLGQAAGLEIAVPQTINNSFGVPIIAYNPAAAPAPSPVVPPVGGNPSTCILICNMFDPATETEPQWDLDVKEDVMEECNKHGPVDHCLVEKNKPGGMVFVKLRTQDAATRAANSLNGRFFAGRMITVTFLTPEMYAEMAY